MKILLFTLEYPPFKGGVSNYYENLVKYWPTPGELRVLHNNNNALLYNWLWPKWLPAFVALWQAIHKYKINHIIVGHILPLGTVTYFLTRLTKTPYSVVMHGMDFNSAISTNRKKLLTEKILNSAEKIICGNTFTAELVFKFLGNSNDKIRIVNPGITPEYNVNPEITKKLSREYNLENKIVLFSLGRLEKRKGFDKVIEAMPIALKELPNLYYVIAGDGRDKMSLINKAMENRSITFLGTISEEEKWAWFDLCHIFIMPSRNIDGDFEGFGIVYLEAGIAGKPVIAGASGGVNDAVEHDVNGLLIDPHNVKSLAEAIIFLAKNPNERARLGSQGRKRAITNFNWRDKISDFYDIIVNDR